MSQENKPLSPKKNQPMREESLFPSFQDKLFESFKIFWKGGFSYAKTGNNEDFYSKVLEDFINLPIDEFLKRYQ